MVSTISIYTYEKIDNNCECFKAVPAPLLRQNGQSLSGYMNNMQLYHVIQATGSQNTDVVSCDTIFTA